MRGSDREHVDCHEDSFVADEGILWKPCYAHYVADGKAADADVLPVEPHALGWVET